MNTLRSAPCRLSITSCGALSRPALRASSVLSVTYCGYWYWVNTLSEAEARSARTGVSTALVIPSAVCCPRQVESISVIVRSYSCSTVRPVVRRMPLENEKG